jgi:hypothetical protein
MADSATQANKPKPKTNLNKPNPGTEVFWFF